DSAARPFPRTATEASARPASLDGELARASAPLGGGMQTIENGSGVGAARASAGDRPIDLREILRALRAMRDGDFSVRLPGEWTGIGGKIADTFNDIVT